MNFLPDDFRLLAAYQKLLTFFADNPLDFLVPKKAVGKSQGEASRMLQISENVFTRYRTRLKELASCFQNSDMRTPVPLKRRRGRRAKTLQAV